MLILRVTARQADVVVDVMATAILAVAAHGRDARAT